MIEEESEKRIQVPLNVVWNWAKDLENILSVIPRVEVVEMKGERKAMVRGTLFRFLHPPDEITVGKTKTVEVNESEKYTRSITENKVYKIETFLQCLQTSEKSTKVILRAKGKLKGLAGATLEKILFFPFISKIVLLEEVEKILNRLGDSLENYMRKKWKEKLEKKIKELNTNSR